MRTPPGGPRELGQAANEHVDEYREYVLQHRGRERFVQADGLVQNLVEETGGLTTNKASKEPIPNRANNLVIGVFHLDGDEVRTATSRRRECPCRRCRRSWG